LTTSPELRAFALLDPQPDNFLLASRPERERNKDGLVFDRALVAVLDAPASKKHHRIDPVEGSVLPLPTWWRTASVTRLLRSMFTHGPRSMH